MTEEASEDDPGQLSLSPMTTVNAMQTQAPSSSSCCTGTDKPPALTNNNPLTSTILKNTYQEKMSYFLPKKLTAKGKINIDKKLMKLFTIDFQPFRIVDDEGFKEFVQALNPSYQLPSRHAISKTAIPALYEECLNSTRNLIKSGNSFCITTDCWSSRNTDSYIAITAHFINEHFDLISVLLECSLMCSTHTSQNLASEIKRIVTDWGIEENILLAVSDNASNIKNAISKGLDLKHLGCFAHTINLVVNEALNVDEISGLIDKIKTIVAHFKRSCTANEKFMTYQKNIGEKPLKLIQDVATRWNSTYFMLERFTKLETAVRSTVALLDKNLPVLTAEEWKECSQLCKVLKPIEHVTAVISGEKYCSASLVIPLTNGLQNVCRNLLKKDFTSSVMEVVKKLQAGLNARLGNVENSATLSVCTFLDPRFKTIAFSNSQASEHTKKIVTSALSTSLANNSATRSEEIDEHHNTAAANLLPAYSDQDEDELSVWHAFDKTVAVTKPKGTPTSRALVEIQRYMDADILPRQRSALKWWKDNAQIFPHLSSLARNYLCAMGTSVPCERLFSKAGILLSERRSRLSENSIKMLLFLNINAKWSVNESP